MTSFTVQVNETPLPGHIEVFPLNGYSLDTKF